MAYTQSDLDNLDAAIASGHLTVRVEGRWIEYRSLPELMQARAHVANQMTAATAGTERRGVFRFRFTTSRGD
jgi:hypothetical protein